MKKQTNDLLLKMQNGENCIGETAKHLLDLLREENVKLLEELGFAYEEATNKFWHIDSETYFDLPIEQCDKDTATIVRLVISFEKNLAYFNGTCAVQNQMRRLLGLDK